MTDTGRGPVPAPDEHPDVPGVDGDAVDDSNPTAGKPGSEQGKGIHDTDGSGTDNSDSDALVAALIEVEQHVGRFGWDQPARLFALVPTAELIAAEPSLAAHLGPGAGNAPEGALSSIEQEDFRSGDDLVTTLNRLTWPETVHGCVLSLERTFLPPRYEGEIPDDPVEAERFVNAHEHRQDMRVVVGVLRGGQSHGVARVRSEPNELLGGPELAPGIAKTLANTLRP